MDLSFLKSYRRMILLEANSDFFGKADVTSLYEWLEQAEISFQYLNLNLQQSVVFLENEKEDSYYIELAQWLCDRIEKEYQEKCYIAVSDPMTEASDLYEVFESLEKRMENKFYQSGQTVFGPAESDGENVLVQIDDDTLMKQMKQDMKMKDIDSLREHFNGLCNKYRNRKNFSHIYIKFIFSNLLKDFYENTPNHKEQELNDEIDRTSSAQRRSSKLLTAMAIFICLGIAAYMVLTLLVNRQTPATPDTHYTGTNGISVYYDSSVWSVCRMTEDATLGTVLELATADTADSEDYQAVLLQRGTADSYESFIEDSEADLKQAYGVIKPRKVNLTVEGAAVEAVRCDIRTYYAVLATITYDSGDVVYVSALTKLASISDVVNLVESVSLS